MRAADLLPFESCGYRRFLLLGEQGAIGLLEGVVVPRQRSQLRFARRRVFDALLIAEKNSAKPLFLGRFRAICRSTPASSVRNSSTRLCRSWSAALAVADSTWPALSASLRFRSSAIVCFSVTTSGCRSVNVDCISSSDDSARSSCSAAVSLAVSLDATGVRSSINALRLASFRAFEDEQPVAIAVQSVGQHLQLHLRVVQAAAFASSCVGSWPL